MDTKPGTEAEIKRQSGGQEQPGSCNSKANIYKDKMRFSEDPCNCNQKEAEKDANISYLEKVRDGSQPADDAQHRHRHCKARECQSRGER